MTLYEKMNEYLANQQVMYIKLHNLHWYVKGYGFFTLHSKLEDLYNQTASVMDEIAERMLALGQSPVGSMKKALALTAVKELEDQPISSVDAAKKLLTDVEYWVHDTKQVVSLAEEADDAATADQFNGYLSEYQKLQWMLQSYLD